MPEKFNRPTLTLTDTHFVAEGSGREIYYHPELPEVVIKIHKPFKAKPLIGLHNLIRRNRRRFGPIMHSFVEADEIASTVGRTGALPSFVSQFLGFIPTSFGVGAMFEAARQTDGTLAPTLMNYAPTKPMETAMTDAIDTLWDAVIAKGIVVSDPSLRNAAVITTDTNSYRLILIDGLGERTLIPIQSMSRTAHRYACEKARQKMQQDYARLAQPA